jgi:mono/diheme cytochrome c family protein
VRRLSWFLFGACFAVLAAMVGGIVFLQTAHGLSAREKPTHVEEWIAREARAMAVPRDTRQQPNPISNSEEVLTEARAHWADHCAVCHANNGSGDTEMGKHMYPPAPDMRQADTQNLTDGELFYIIQNGIRLTGMPSWGSGKGRDEEHSWKLVHLIRHLPKLTAEEEHEMQELNPKTREEIKEEQQERDFLNGVQSHEQTQHEHH